MNRKPLEGISWKAVASDDTVFTLQLAGAGRAPPEEFQERGVRRTSVFTTSTHIYPTWVWYYTYELIIMFKGEMTWKSQSCFTMESHH
ncbi:hypothetical protein [Paenibacillus uliginis]|uniref:hypothetical protein n=1 Tax=Paenibacillus uliginis TaxID=683737 RepID=UPI001AD7F489|nr:hypothetical protein [Paenibacillus uliginis]